MAVINPSFNQKAIKDNWTLKHSICLFAVVTGIPFWFSTPFLTRNLEGNSWHKFFRFMSVGYGIASSIVALKYGTELGQLQPKIETMNKQELAEFKHAIATDIYLAQNTNSAIAQFLLIERQGSLTPVTEFPESYTMERGNPSVYGEFPDFPESSKSSKTAGNSITELERNLELYMEPVLEALENGMTDSEIVKDVLKMKGRSYGKGKQVLNEIKNYLNLEED